MKTKNYQLKIQKSLLALAIIFVYPLTFIWALHFAHAETINELQKQINALNQKTQALQQQENQYKSLVNNTRSQARTLQNAVAILNNQISTLKLETAQTKTKITATQYEIQLTELESQKTSEQIDSNRENLATILRLLNSNDTTSLFEAMLLSNSLSSFINDRSRIQALEENMQSVVDNLKTYKKSLEQQSVKLKQQKSNLEEYTTQLGVQQDALSDQRGEKKSLLAKTKGQEHAYQQMLLDVSRQESKLFKEIQILQQRVEAQKNFLQYSESDKVPPPGTPIFIWPEANPTVTQGYGMTSYARAGHYGGQIHNGVDMSSGLGTPIMAAADGIVFASGRNTGWGNWIALKHANNLVTLYGHMVRPTTLKTGARVTAGQTIGYEGATGFATGSHVHFSVYKKFFTFYKDKELYFNYDGILNPFNYLVKR